MCDLCPSDPDAAAEADTGIAERELRQLRAQLSALTTVIQFLLDGAPEHVAAEARAKMDQVPAVGAGT